MNVVSNHQAEVVSSRTSSLHIEAVYAVVAGVAAQKAKTRRSAYLETALVCWLYSHKDAHLGLLVVEQTIVP